MSDRRPPSKATGSAAVPVARAARRGHAASIHDEHTLIAPRAGPGHSSDEATNTIHHLGSDDVSLIDDARGPAPSASGFEVPPHERMFVAPPAAIEQGSFGDPRPTGDPMLRTSAVTDALTSAERPVRVRKWRLGGDDDALSAEPVEASARKSRARTAGSALPSLDVVELRGSLKDAERLLDAMGEHLIRRDLTSAKAELRAAQHRLADALALLARP